MELLSRKGAWVHALAPAKVNLFLHITGRREDGFHELESLFVFVDFGDEIRVRAADELSLRISGPFAQALDGAVSDNLVMRAARAVQATAGTSVGAEIILEKNLPIAAGIGGGSSDAAATIRALEALWELGLSDRARFDLAERLGADVPACLDARPKLVRGIGEKLAPFDAPDGLFIVLANPGIALSTPAVFGAYVRSGAPFSESMGGEINWVETLAAGNDLQASATELAPEIEKLLNVLHSDQQAVKVGMSGSGATCFALFATQDGGKKCAQTIEGSGVATWAHFGRVVVAGG